MSVLDGVTQQESSFYSLILLALVGWIIGYRSKLSLLPFGFESGLSVTWGVSFYFIVLKSSYKYI